MRIDPKLPELTVVEAERCFMTPSEVWDLAVRKDLELSEGPRFLNNVSDGEFVPFEKSGIARTSRRLYSAISAVQLRAMWEVTRSGRSYKFAAPIAEEVARVAKEMIDRSRDFDDFDGLNWLVVYRTNFEGEAHSIVTLTQGQMVKELDIGSYDIGVVRASSMIGGVLQRYPEYWAKDRRARGLSMPSPRYQGNDDEGLPLDPDHEGYLDWPPLERAKRRLEIEEFIARREAKEQVDET